MRADQPPPGDRFFARLLSVLLECPSCGFLDAFRWRKLTARTIRRRKAGAYSAKAKQKQRYSEQTDGWDPATGLWRCPQCKRRFVLGLLAWPMGQHAGGEPTRPRDQVPSERELGQLRARNVGGLWLPEALRQASKRPEHSNITARCSCQPGTAYTDQRDRACPLHGEEGPDPPE
jgi:rubrerythrin